MKTKIYKEYYDVYDEKGNFRPRAPVHEEKDTMTYGKLLFIIALAYIIVCLVKDIREMNLFWIGFEVGFIILMISDVIHYYINIIKNKHEQFNGNPSQRMTR